MSSATGLGRPRTPNTMFRSAENIATPMHQFPVRLQMMIQDLASEISHAIGRFHENYNELADTVNQSAGYITLKPLELNRLSNPEEMVRMLMPHDLSFIPDPFSDPRMTAMNESFKHQRPGGLPSPPRPVSRSSSSNHDLSRSAKRQRRPASPGPEEASAFTPLMTLSSLSASLLDDPKSLSEVQTSPNIEEPLFPMDDWEELKMIKEMANSHIVLRPEYDTTSRFTPLHRAIAESAMNSDPTSLVRLEELIKNVQDPFLPDRNGWTPLQVAAFHGNEKGVTLLLQHGHPIDARTLNGMTPLHFATLFNRIDVMHLLLQHGHPVTPKNDEGATPLYLAAMNNAPDAMALLIRHGHPITVTTNMGATPLHAAAFHNSTLAIDVLVQCDDQVDVQDKNGMTPLHWAALNNSVKAIELLVRNKHSIDVRDYRGRTPIQIAATCDQQDSSKALGNLRADICGLTKLRGGNGISPIPAYPFNSQNADVQVS
jgi:ankyrin repeat protein